MKRFISIFSLFLILFSVSPAQNTWQIDKAHSNLDFSVRYMMLSNVRGSYDSFDAVLVQHNDGFSGSEIQVTVQAATINTQNSDRDNHLRSSDFFDIENHPDLKFVSREFQKSGDGTYTILGDLTMRGVTKPVTIDAEMIGLVDDPRGFQRVAFTGETTVNRNDFGVQWNRALEAGGFLVGENVRIMINAQFISQ